MCTAVRIVKNPNKLSVVEYIRHAPEEISRADIARLLGVSRSRVSVIVDELIAAGLVVEGGAGVSRGGRRPIGLGVNPEAGRVVGVDLGATHLLVVVTDFCGQVRAELQSSQNIADGPEVCLLGVRQLVTRALVESGLDQAQVAAFGVGVPGPVDIRRGMVSAPPIMPGWDGFPIRDTLEAAWGRPVALDNDAGLGALGEWAYGAARGESNMAYIKVGTGIGCGILIDGRIYHGVLGTAGEIGHVTVSDDGPPCACGNYGCLEAMAGGRAIAQRAHMAVLAGQRTSLAAVQTRRAITALDVAAAAAEGDPVSQQLLNDAGRHIGSALASLINLLNPGLVLLGGGLTGAGALLLDPVRAALTSRSLSASLSATRIGLAGLGRRSTALGAAYLALTGALERALDGTERIGAALAEA